MLKEFYTEGDTDAAVEAFIQNFDHHSPFFRTHYFNILKRVAGREHVVRSNVYDGGFSIVANADLIGKVANRADVFSSTHGYRAVPLSTIPFMMPDDLDGPEHDFYRRLLLPHFSPKVVAAYAVAVQADIDECMEEAKARGRVDVPVDLGQPVTGRLTMRILGLPEDDWRHYSLPVHNAALCIGPYETRMEEGRGFALRVKQEIARMMQMPDPPGLIGHLVKSDLDGRTLTAADIEAVVINLIFGGLDTTQAVIGSTAVYLGRHPERRRELAEHPERIPNAVREFLRLFASAPLTGRLIKTDLDIDDHHFEAGKTTLLFWAAGNFDPAFNDRPFEVDFTRTQSKNMTFAMGPHRCLGQQLAIQELTALIKALVALPHYTLIEDEVKTPDDVGATFAFMNAPVSLAAS